MIFYRRVGIGNNCLKFSECGRIFPLVLLWKNIKTENCYG